MKKIIRSISVDDIFGDFEKEHTLKLPKNCKILEVINSDIKVNLYVENKFTDMEFVEFEKWRIILAWCNQEIELSEEYIYIGNVIFEGNVRFVYAKKIVNELN